MYYPDSVDTLRLVHAICRSSHNTNTSDTNVLYIHAYVKSLEDNLCFFDVNLNNKQLHCMVETTQYETSLDIQSCVEYTVREVLSESRKFNTSGPWTNALLDFCDKRNYNPSQIMGELKNITVKLFERKDIS